MDIGLKKFDGKGSENSGDKADERIKFNVCELGWPPCEIIFAGRPKETT
jgi:hypothetical protein